MGANSNLEEAIELSEQEKLMTNEIEGGVLRTEEYAKLQNSVDAANPSIDHGRSLQNDDVESRLARFCGIQTNADTFSTPLYCTLPLGHQGECYSNQSCAGPPVESRLIVWSLTTEGKLPTSRTDDSGIIAAHLREKMLPYFGAYWLTEMEAIEAARRHAKDQEAFWYDRINYLDKRIDEIELAGQVEMDASN